MLEKPDNYASYLLRIWHAREVRDVWRVSLENAQTHELRGFANLEEVFTFLSQVIKSQRQSDNNLTQENTPLQEE